MTSVNPPTPARRESAHTPLAGTLSPLVGFLAVERLWPAVHASRNQRISGDQVIPTAPTDTVCAHSEQDSYS